MRSAFVETLTELAGQDRRIMLLTADLGWSVLEPFAAAHPDRFLNVGVAEQNMMGVATGLARAGFVPFVYSIATFATMRGYEQLRDGPVLHQLPVRVIGIGGGFAYGHAGPTHYAPEDLAITRTQAGLTVIAPADASQARAAIRAAAALPGPVYLRLDKSEEADLPTLAGRFALGRPEVVRDGRDLLLLCTGSIAREALGAADLLEAHDVSAAVAVLAHLGFAGSAALRSLLRRYRAVMTVEEGYVAGGLGSLAAETIAQAGLRCRLCMHGVKTPLGGVTGEAAYMRRRHQLDAASLARSAAALVQKRAAA